MAWFQVGSKVKIRPDNDNECYDSFRRRVMIITSNEIGGRGYDREGSGGGPLYCMKFADTGESVPVSLYHWELTSAR